MTKWLTFLPEHFRSEMRSVEQSGHSCRLRQADLDYNATGKRNRRSSSILFEFV